MSVPGFTPKRLALVLAVTAGLGTLGALLRTAGWRPADLLQQQSYDSLHALAPERTPQTPDGSPPVVLVYLDLDSYHAHNLNTLQPWPRALHARLLRKLTQLGARAIVLDVVFADPGPNPEGDRDLADAIRESGRVILAGQANTSAGAMTDPRQPWQRILSLEPPNEQFASQAAAWGAANHVVDDDLVVRRTFAGFTSQPLPSLAWATAAWLNLPATKATDGVRRANQTWLRYYGPPLSLPHVSFHQALRDGGVPDGFFRNKVVLVGARPMTGPFQQRQDEFRSPFHSWRNRQLFHPGVEIHAIALLNLLNGDALRRPAPATEVVLLFAVATIATWGLLQVRPLAATGLALAGSGTTLGLSLVLFDRGTWIPWLIPAAIQIPGALFASWLVQFRDWYVTRRTLEAARIADEARIREQAALIDKATDAIVVRDLQGRLVYANPAARSLYGWTDPSAPDPAPNTEPRTAPHRSRPTTDPQTSHPSILEPAIASTLSAGEWHGEVRHRRTDGRELVIESRWTLIRDAAGQPQSLLAIDTDVTERRQLETEAHRLQRTEAIGALASGMAHDLNNALAPVLMGTQLLRRDAPTEEMRRILQLMESSTRRGADMVRQVVLFARGRPGETERLDLRTLVGDLVKLARETFPKSITVSAHCASDLWPVRGNPTEIHQVLLNLCVNARDAMPDGGHLDLAVDNIRLEETEAHKIPGARAGEFVTLLVSDSGSGIPAEILPRIFDPFFTTKAPGHGTGLGLSTTARIIKSHDGFLSVSSQPGEGTTFEIFLPRSHEAQISTTAEPRLPKPQGRGDWILVADDDQAVREVLRRGLEDHGYRVVTAADGPEALHAFHQAPEPFRLVLCDRDMPGLSGAEILRQLRERCPGLPVVLMTGEGEPDTARSQPTSGADLSADAAVTQLHKPFSLQRLLATVEASLVRTASPGSDVVRARTRPPREGC